MRAQSCVILLGRLTAAPVPRTSAAGNPYLSCTIALSKGARDDQGKSDADYVDCVIYDEDRALKFAEHATKGRPIYVRGYLQQWRWTDQDQRNRSRLVVVIASYSWLGAPGHSAPPEEAPADAAQ